MNSADIRVLDVAPQGTPLEMCSINETYILVKLWRSYEIMQNSSCCLVWSRCSIAATHDARGDRRRRGESQETAFFYYECMAQYGLEGMNMKTRTPANAPHSFTGILAW